MADALWLRKDAYDAITQGSAYQCLAWLVSCCVIFGWIERTLVSSWHSLGQALISHFCGLYIFGAVPSLLVVLATAMPKTRKLRRKTEPKRSKLFDPSWTLFFSTRLILTMILTFLISVVVNAPARLLLAKGADWTEVLTATVAVSIGIRWALIDQEKRCRTCLRLLSNPTRIGPPSRNLLDWNGTELVCAGGHGLLRIPEMEGSWCWYDAWIEFEAAWQRH
jgi:hypothetical protein